MAKQQTETDQDMTQETSNENTETKKTFTVFGTLPPDSIFNPIPSYNLRNDCQVGQWKFGDSDYKGNELEIAIIKASKHYGNLGESKKMNWLQLWFIPSPKEQKIPANTVCCTYIKTKSMDLLGGKLIELMRSQIDPGMGIWKASFVQNKGKLGTYYNLNWEYREREGEKEQEQFDLICDFMQSNPSFADTSKPKTLLCVDGLEPDEIEALDPIIDRIENEEIVSREEITNISEKVALNNRKLLPVS